MIGWYGRAWNAVKSEPYCGVGQAVEWILSVQSLGFGLH